MATFSFSIIPLKQGHEGELTALHLATLNQQSASYVGKAVECMNVAIVSMRVRVAPSVVSCCSCVHSYLLPLCAHLDKLPYTESTAVVELLQPTLANSGINYFGWSLSLVLCSQHY